MVTLNDVLNKKKNKRNQPKATKKYVIHSNKNVILLQPKVAPWHKLRRDWTTTVPKLHPKKIHVKTKNEETVPVTGNLKFSIINGVVLIQSTLANTAAVLYLSSDLYRLGNNVLETQSVCNIEVISRYKLLISTKSNLSFECKERYILIALI